MFARTKANLWDLSALLMGLFCVVAGALLVVAQLGNLPILNFYSRVILLTFLPVLIIYIWTEKVVEWMNINSRILDMIALTVRAIAIMMFITFAGSYIISMYKDIPYAVTANYSYAMGKPVSAVKTTGTGRRAYLAVDGVRFDVRRKTANDINRNSELRVIYLPNSKFVIYMDEKLPEAPSKGKKVQETRTVSEKTTFLQMAENESKKVLN